MELLQYEWVQFTIKLLAAFVLAFPIGWEREHNTRIMGLRTFPLVAVASAAYVLLGLKVLQGNPDAEARIIQGLMTGIGFIGGGAILKDTGGTVHGTATAVSVWNTGVLGAAIAYGYFNIAVILSLINFLVLRLLTPMGSDRERENKE